MASQKISQFTAITTLASGDYFPVIQASGTTNRRVDVGVLDVRYAASASGTAAQATANAALASGNAALIDAGIALASGNAALGDLSSKVSKAGDVISGTLTVTSRAYGQPSSTVASGQILLDFSAANNFDVTLEGDSTLAPSVSPSGGQSGAIFIRQDGTGSRLLSYSGGWSFSNGAAPTLTLTASGVDLLVYYCPQPSTIVGNLIAAVSGV
jgi:hypothetical protein